MRRMTTLTALLLFTATVTAHAEEPRLPPLPDYPAMVKQAIEKSLPAIQKSAANFVTKVKCTSCHHQSLPSMTYSMARQHGFKIDEKAAKVQAEAVYGFFAASKDLLAQAQTEASAERVLDKITVDPAATVSYFGAGLAADRWKPDAVTENMALYLAKKQTPEGYWPLLESRPPLQSSEFTTTALSLIVLQNYAPASQAKVTAERIARAKNWLRTTPAKSNEDRTFKLIGLHLTGATKEEIRATVNDLLSKQQDDGGWGQLDNMASDAYATGQALVALHMAGDIPISHSAFHRGYKYLLKTQKPDGSWLVEARTIPLQVFVDTAFPHGKHQFLSISATCWATMALTLTVDPKDAKVAFAH